MAATLRGKTLFLSLDAFGTIFHPRRPIAQQYAEVGSEYGFPRIPPAELQQSFTSAFKEQSKKNPNYGKATGMNAEQWWENIIKSTFRPYVNQNGAPQDIPPEMIQKLLHRFSSKEGYALFSDAEQLFSTLRSTKTSTSSSTSSSPSALPSTTDWPWSRTIVNVTSNSDARIESVLESLQITIGKQDADIEHVTLSYAVGAEKPDARMFEAAARNAPEEAVKVHVGDDLRKDVVAAMDAGGGWYGLLLDRNGQAGEWRPDEKSKGIMRMENDGRTIVGIDSLEALRYWRPDLS